MEVNGTGFPASPSMKICVVALVFLIAIVLAGRVDASTRAREQRSIVKIDVVQDTGARLYALTCITCHKADGLGIPDSVPPLSGSEWITNTDRMLRIVLGGLQGEIEVQGEFFNAAMPGWGTTLNDFDIAAVATYVRKSWGNKAPLISPDVVAQIRKATATRTMPWTAAELRRIGG
jgi:cytochrome c